MYTETGKKMLTSKDKHMTIYYMLKYPAHILKIAQAYHQKNHTVKGKLTARKSTTFANDNGTPNTQFV